MKYMKQIITGLSQAEIQRPNIVSEFKNKMRTAAIQDKLNGLIAKQAKNDDQREQMMEAGRIVADNPSQFGEFTSLLNKKINLSSMQEKAQESKGMNYEELAEKLIEDISTSICEELLPEIVSQHKEILAKNTEIHKPGAELSPESQKMISESISTQAEREDVLKIMEIHLNNNCGVFMEKLPQIVSIVKNTMGDIIENMNSQELKDFKINQGKKMMRATQLLSALTIRSANQEELDQEEVARVFTTAWKTADQESKR